MDVNNQSYDTLLKLGQDLKVIPKKDSSGKEVLQKSDTKASDMFLFVKNKDGKTIITAEEKRTRWFGIRYFQTWNRTELNIKDHAGEILELFKQAKGDSKPDDNLLKVKDKVLDILEHAKVKYDSKKDKLAAKNRTESQDFKKLDEKSTATTQLISDIKKEFMASGQVGEKAADAFKDRNVVVVESAEKPLEPAAVPKSPVAQAAEVVDEVFKGAELGQEVVVGEVDLGAEKANQEVINKSKFVNEACTLWIDSAKELSQSALNDVVSIVKPNTLEESAATMKTLEGIESKIKEATGKLDEAIAFAEETKKETGVDIREDIYGSWAFKFINQANEAVATVRKQAEEVQMKALSEEGTTPLEKTASDDRSAELEEMRKGSKVKGIIEELNLKRSGAVQQAEVAQQPDILPTAEMAKLKEDSTLLSNRHKDVWESMPGFSRELQDAMSQGSYGVAYGMMETMINQKVEPYRSVLEERKILGSNDTDIGHKAIAMEWLEGLNDYTESTLQSGSLKGVLSDPRLNEGRFTGIKAALEKADKEIGSLNLKTQSALNNKLRTLKREIVRIIGEQNTVNGKFNIDFLRGSLQTDKWTDLDKLLFRLWTDSANSFSELVNEEPESLETVKNKLSGDLDRIKQGFERLVIDSAQSQASLVRAELLVEPVLAENAPVFVEPVLIESVPIKPEPQVIVPVEVELLSQAKKEELIGKIPEILVELDGFEEVQRAEKDSLYVKIGSLKRGVYADAHNRLTEFANKTAAGYKPSIEVGDFDDNQDEIMQSLDSADIILNASNPDRDLQDKKLTDAKKAMLGLEVGKLFEKMRGEINSWWGFTGAKGRALAALDSLKIPQDLKKLSIEQMRELVGKISDFYKDTMSVHLTSVKTSEGENYNIAELVQELTDDFEDMFGEG